MARLASGCSGWSNEETFQFIELYQNNAEIWDPRHKYHKDKNRICDAWERIAEEMQVPVAELKKKKESLLASFRLNHRKVIASLESGSEEDDVFKPIWIFYDALAAFMTNVYTCKSIVFVKEPGDIFEDDDVNYDIQLSPRPQESKSPQVSSVQKRRSKKIPEITETSEKIHTTLTTLSTLNDVLIAKKNKDVNVDEDDCDLYGRLLARALREFNEIDRLELRHEIDGLIIKKKRSLICQHNEASPSQIIISSNYSQNAHSKYKSEQSIEGSPTFPQSNNSILGVP